MPLIRRLVDIEALAVDHLEQDAELAALIGGTGNAARVSTELPASHRFETRVQVFAATASEVDPATHHLDRPVLQVAGFGATKGEAFEVCAEAVRALLEAPAGSHTGAVVTAAERITGPAWAPDDTTRPPTPRYLASVALTVHPV